MSWILKLSLVWNSRFFQIAPSIHFLLLLWKFATKSLLKRTEICLGWKQNPSLRWGHVYNFGAVMGNPLGAFPAFISPPCPLTFGSFYQKFGKIHQILGIYPYRVSPISSKNESWNYCAHFWITQDTLLVLKGLSTNCVNTTCNLNFPFPCSLTSSLSLRWDESRFGDDCYYVLLYFFSFWRNGDLECSTLFTYTGNITVFQKNFY